MNPDAGYRTLLRWDDVAGSTYASFVAWCANHHIEVDDIAEIEGTNHWWPSGEAVMVFLKDGGGMAIMPGPAGLTRHRQVCAANPSGTVSRCRDSIGSALSNVWGLACIIGCASLLAVALILPIVIWERL